MADADAARGAGIGAPSGRAVDGEGAGSFGSVRTVTPLGGGEPVDRVSSTPFSLAPGRDNAVITIHGVINRPVATALIAPCTET